MMPRRLLALLFAVVALGVAGCTGVNPAPTPAAAAPSGHAQSLAGEWRFALDREDQGVNEAWFSRPLPDRIHLPGILQAQGYGDQIRTDTPWVATLGDAWWKLQPASLRDPFSQPGRVKVPFLAQPPRHYLGAAWYQRDFTVAPADAGRRFVLFLERAHWQSTVWVDGRAYEPNRSLVAPHTTDLGVLAVGAHHLTIRVDNRQIVRDPQNDGHETDAHAVSDALGATWNGIVGRIELQSTPLVWLDDVQVFPNITNKSARVRLVIGNASGQPGAGELKLSATGGTPIVQAVTWQASGGVAEADVPLSERAAYWDEFHPVLQHVTATLSAGPATDSREVTFGLREVVGRDRDFVVNGRVVNLRSTHFGGDFPLTGYPAMDVPAWKAIFRTCQEYGLNGMRFHSWCPPEAAFEAADELGFYLQPECGLWAPFNPGSAYTKYLEEETPKLLKAYGNHPSFVLLSPSNEPAGRYTQITPKWAAAEYARDPRRLYSAGTGWAAREQVTGGAQYASLVRFGRGELRNVAGWFGRDYRTALEDVHIPVFAHEVGQWCAYPNFDEIREFTGYLQPGNFEIFKYIAGQTGVLEYNRQFAWASGRFQLAYYKEEIEANLRTPGLAGYQLLDLHDYLGQGTALIGVLDAFWKSKGYVTPEEFRRFNSQTVPLARLAQRTFTTADTLSAEVELYHFAADAVPRARAYWKIVSVPAAGADEKVVAEGRFDERELPLGKNLPLGSLAVPLGRFAAPAEYRLVVGIDGAQAENDWKFWVYPAQISDAVPNGVTETSSWSEAEARLAAGGRVLFTPAPGSLDPARCPPMKRVPVFWNIQMTVRPPRNLTPRFDAMLGLLCDTKSGALAEFPTQAYCDWQWTPLIDNVPAVNLTAAPRELHPIVAAIDDWNRNWRLGVIFECRVGRGRLLVSAIPLSSTAASPGRQQLRRSLLDYAASARFEPTASLSTEQCRQLWSGATTTPTTGPRAYDPDLDDGSSRSGARKR